MITKKLLSDYLDEYKKGIHPLEFLLDMFTKYCDDSIPIEPPVSLQKGGKEIKGIQVIAKEITYPLIGQTRSGCYLIDPIEMTIDFKDGKNTILSTKRLQALLSK